jgi:fatty acid desaturase
VILSLNDLSPAPLLNNTSLKGLVADHVRQAGRLRGVEWPTVVLTVAIYGMWLVLTWDYAALPIWVFLPLTTLFVTWHSSLQHEVLHGHPTRSRAINRLIGLPPLMIWLPYERYRQTHLTHHIDERLTDPIDDPESYYWTREGWHRLNALSRLIVRAQTTLLGRVTIGPFWSALNFLAEEAGRVMRGAPQARIIWLEHALWLVPVSLWLFVVCDIPVWLYLLGVAMPATGLMMVRSFCEHHATEPLDHRTAVVENSWFFGPLFLFNNLHVVHHHVPLMPWYQIPSWYRAHREAILKANGGLVYNGYGDVARRYFLRSYQGPEHPLDRIARG